MVKIGNAERWTRMVSSHQLKLRCLTELSHKWCCQWTAHHGGHPTPRKDLCDYEILTAEKHWPDLSQEITGHEKHSAPNME